MTESRFALLTVASSNAIYTGKWRYTLYSVTVRYKQREVSMSAGGTRQKDVAKALLAELVAADSRLRSKDVA